MSQESETTGHEAVCLRCGRLLYSDGSCSECSTHFGEVRNFTEPVGGPPEPASSEAQKRRLNETRTRSFGVCLFTDLVDSISLKRRLGDREASRLIRLHNEVFRAALREHRGVERNNPGDGFFATFPTPTHAVNCALAFLLRLSQLKTSEPLRVKVGINLGGFDIVLSEGHARETILGLAVDVAARVMALALPQQILMTKPVFDDARQAIGGTIESGEIQWIAHGFYNLEGLPEPFEIYEVGTASLSPMTQPLDSTKGHRQAVVDAREEPGWRPAVGLGIPNRPGWILRRKLGEGAFGEVWLADKVGGWMRVFKFCFRSDRVNALRREINVLGWLREKLGERADIASLLDWQLDSPPFFLESTYVPGLNLLEWAEGHGSLQQIPLETRLEVAAQAATALAAAHSVGVLHKDMKPSNILVGASEAGKPRVRLTDFGVGEVIQREQLANRAVPAAQNAVKAPLPTLPVSSSGTPTYMAPEVQTGQPATTRSDIFSMGVVLYQLVVGDFRKIPSEGWAKEVKDALLEADIRSCIYGNPEERLSSADELAHRLREIGSRRRKHEAETREIKRRATHQWRVAIGLTLFALIGAFFLLQRHDAARTELAQTNQAVSRLIAKVIERHMETAEVLVDRDAGSMRLRQLLESHKRASPENTDALASLRVFLNESMSVPLETNWIQSAALADSRGTMLAHATLGADGIAPDVSVLGAKFALRDWFRGEKENGKTALQGDAAVRTVSNTHVSEPYPARTKGSPWKLAVSTPVVSELDALPLGVVQVALEINYLQKWIFEAAGDSITRDVVVVNRAGQIVLYPFRSSRSTKELTPLTPGEWPEAAELNEGVTRSFLDPADHRFYDVSVSKATFVDESFTILVRSPPTASRWTWLGLGILFAIQLMWAAYLALSPSLKAVRNQP